MKNLNRSQRYGTWDSTQERNLLLPQNLERVRREFGNHGVVFGWHYHYGGGGSGTLFAFGDYEAYLRELSRSRPGDHLTVYSLSSLVGLAIARVGSASCHQPVSVDEGFVPVREALAGEGSGIRLAADRIYFGPS